MCGIIGFNFKSNNNKVFTIADYRGPNNTSKSEIGNFTLGHNRLSIVDHNPLSNQPMVSSCGRYIIVFNGEIYNHTDIREKLKYKYNFKTLSDTEVILYSYIEYGENCVNYFRGMFAFAIYDKEIDKLFCARDRLGIKPFSYFYKNGKFIFGSEIKIILEALGYTPSINQEAIMQYLHYLYIPYPNTIFKDIMKLPPAHILIYENGLIKTKKYWDSSNFVGLHHSMDESTIITSLDKILDDSIHLRMIADVELGSFLSGGIDSSMILYYMQKNSNKKINTYTLGFKDAKNYDETSDARVMADFFKTNHNEIIIEPKVGELLPKMVKHFDEPFGNPTALLIHELTKETKKLATVALAGDGGDEIFGGYPRYEAILLANKLKYIPKSIFSLISNFAKLMPESSDGNHRLRRIKTFINSLSKNSDEMYEDWIGYFDDNELKQLLKNYKEYKHIVNDIWNSQSYNNDILKSSIVDLKTFLPNNLLYYGDAMSMANSFEVRFPLIDHNIIEFMTGIDAKYRIRNRQTKYLMKKILKGKIPDIIINKPKLGLNPPMGMWLKKDLKRFIDDYLSKESVEKRDLFNYKYINRIIYEHEHNKKDRSLYIWALIVLEEWFRQYID
ncbi:asparagine synthase (glutamine-hydrolyzing) [Campylobacter hyointestinalis subsp. hyointestinalis]|uniref:asparagine synthase (glutamine-hydrolyzing) n=1 Tax=Campylobacter hyointestinalis TaxID=198 RepID=UPI0007251FF5|nr:asparagine synthase (glutamine-hydrolyzing) [Campylobacter hyointestinalis]PPB57983.1 asparagine synthase (glutamine-hydrolyzing) [Campylobacter hyointestinalis subsp. hyointestinalis]QCT99181.1 asparagine synthase (glutamine-hydrolyzing) [Campylobacter hyointestinalis subsp. hyointestinalis]CUU68066.1 asparagine synthase [Campylobacter hyointestinalis subsp. hyointestinalis]